MTLKQCKECGRQVSAKAIIWGVMVDNIGYVCFMTILSFAVVKMGIKESVINNQIETIANIILALGFTFLGGYIAVRIAGYSEILHGGIVGAIGLLIGLIIIVAMSYPIRWSEIVCFVGIIPIGMGGGFVAKTRK
jgi:putative membrane protein (TIGR04086 family)